MRSRASAGFAGIAVALLLPQLAPASQRGTRQAAPRLEGPWTISLVYTVAEGLQDRRVGQKVTERWVVRPRCKSGPCAVDLQRAGRRLLLCRSGSTYRGTGSFTGAFFCNGQTYSTGTTYVESWTVRVRRSGPGARGRRALAIAGVGATVGRSGGDLPCAPVVSRERVEFSGVTVRP